MQSGDLPDLPFPKSSGDWKAGSTQEGARLEKKREATGPDPPAAPGSGSRPGAGGGRRGSGAKRQKRGLVLAALPLLKRAA